MVQKKIHVDMIMKNYCQGLLVMMMTWQIHVQKQYATEYKLLWTILEDGNSIHSMFAGFPEASGCPLNKEGC